MKLQNSNSFLTLWNTSSLTEQSMFPPRCRPKRVMRQISGHQPQHTPFHTSGQKITTTTAPRARPEHSTSTLKASSSAISRQATTDSRVPPRQPSDPAEPPPPASSTKVYTPRTPYLSPSALNAFAVSTLSAQAHPSRPAPKVRGGSLPKNYKAAARRITLAMVAAPIAIVTSWVLWERCEWC